MHLLDLKWRGIANWFKVSYIRTKRFINMKHKWGTGDSCSVLKSKGRLSV